LAEGIRAVTLGERQLQELLAAKDRPTPPATAPRGDGEGFCFETFHSRLLSRWEAVEKQREFVEPTLGERQLQELLLAKVGSTNNLSLSRTCLVTCWGVTLGERQLQELLLAKMDARCAAWPAHRL